MVAINVTQFNMPSLAASTGMGKGTILEFDLAGNILPTVGTYKTVSAIEFVVASIITPNYFWLTGPTLSDTLRSSSDTIYYPIPWSIIVYGSSANLDTTTCVWTCTGLWQCTFM